MSKGSMRGTCMIPSLGLPPAHSISGTGSGGGGGGEGPGRLWAAQRSGLGLAEAGRSAAGPSRGLTSKGEGGVHPRSSGEPLRGF